MMDDLIIGREYNYKILDDMFIKIRYVDIGFIKDYIIGEALEDFQETYATKGKRYYLYKGRLSEVELQYDPAQQADQDDDV